ncbi:hypothetical protein CcaverHIS002_0109070 [Cutaneotrichosporon cavernicola]|uniref:Uncharacterized protein n=1 Tax=Cutaneotrichosporon cavernicola TaxID=279322 RepID=A0AA48HZ68_9TREE|nr:uncharacterized protein CcaverHIS019_0108990 [Cutaneotrichosporon cavernicola]BEI80378.1 hypothetical protein CcaverHIS002_0109070 [Cutaneotrichosporon cavernicola]BEI88181.1 hypothetical protein CcaverHIS019_0108990 [Cutaneotrichosporon cavernicola]BEI95953.1 hypothetical protein CcaverHIS631_0109020 [Cutaneotrichosporon cavernicola]BEJ03727.1 hypothetical protein CcaverHIS641_0109020 [Cutaneotrichosporon cavernicola]
MASKSAYGFLKEVETLVLVIADLAAVDPPTSSRSWWNDNGDWYPIERGRMRGCVAPHCQYITGFGDETYGLEELGMRCSMLSIEEYKDSIGEEAYWIEMGEMGAPRLLALCQCM